MILTLFADVVDGVPIPGQRCRYKHNPQSLRQNSRQGQQPWHRCSDSGPRAFSPHIFQELLNSSHFRRVPGLQIEEWTV